jgi:anti-sigma B factor antagonist
MDIHSIEQTVKVATISVTGRLDALSAPDLHAGLMELRDAGYTRFVVDMSTVTFVDSAGLAVLIRTMKDARSKGGDVEIVQPRSADAMRVFRLTRFDHVFSMHVSMPIAYRNGAPWQVS